MSRLVLVAAWAVGVAAGASGCARLHARSNNGPPLNMPAPPARVVPIASQPIPIGAAPTVDDVPSRAPEPINPPAPPPPPRAVERGEQAPPARTEAPADAGGAAAPAPAPPAANVPTLQTTANPTEAEQRTRTALENAKRDLGRIDVRRLNNEARSQYDIAKRFVQQAEEALKNRNPVFAEQLADKAATLAGLLQKQ